MKRDRIAIGQGLSDKMATLESRLSRVHLGDEFSIRLSQGEVVAVSPAVQRVIKMLAVSEMQDQLAEYTARLEAL